jgi:apolipoprotein N-acyltransferase
LIFAKIGGLYPVKMVTSWFLAYAAGLAMGLATAPFSLWFLAWLALAPLWFLVALEYKSWRRVSLLATAWGLGYYGFALFWITGVHPLTWMGVPWLTSLLIALVCWLLITAWGTALAIVWALGLAWLYRQGKGTVGCILGGVAWWCILESVWSSGPLWWSSLAATQSPVNLWILQWGQFSGTSLITSLIVGVNGLLAESLQSKRRSLGITGITILIFAHLVGGWLFMQPLKDLGQGLNVGIIQGNIPNTIKLYPEGWRKAIAGYTQGYRLLAAQGVDVVLTPETALPFTWSEIRNGSSFYRAILEEKIPVWLGAFGTLGSSYTNSLLMVPGTGELTSRFDKVKLVPLGEYIPLASVFGAVIERLSPLDAHLAPGSPEQVFTTPFGRVAVGICYESAFAEHFRRQVAQGAKFIVTASNNAHYSAAMPAQHHALDIMRAIENDRWMARATNTGLSAFVNPRGETLWLSALNTYAIHKGRIYPRNTQTLYVLWGDWWSKILAVGLIFLAQKKGSTRQ